MNKQYQGSKKKARQVGYEARKRKRLLKATERKTHNALMATGDLELMAKAMDIPLY